MGKARFPDSRRKDDLSQAFASLAPAMGKGYEYRKEQVQMAEMVRKALEQERHAVIEAGTGIGKSLGYLLPAIHSGKKVIVSTARKNLQDQLANQDLPLLQKVFPLSFAVLKGRSSYLCNLRVEELGLEESSLFETGEDARHFRELAQWAEQTETGDLEEFPSSLSGPLREQVTVGSEECLGKKCPLFSGCFAENAKEKARDAQVVITNHHLLLLDLLVRERTGSTQGLLPEAEGVVIDEAQHLEEVAVNVLGVYLTLGRLNYLGSGLRSLVPLVAQASLPSSKWGNDFEKAYQELSVFFTNIQTRLQARNKGYLRLQDERPLAQNGTRLLADLAQDMKSLTVRGLAQKTLARWEKLAELISRFAADLNRVCSTEWDEDFVRFAALESGKRGIALYSKPIEVSRYLERLLFHLSSEKASSEEAFPEEEEEKNQPVVICTSATLAAPTLSFFLDRVGLKEEKNIFTLTLGSPFDYPRKALVHLPKQGKKLDPTLGRSGEAKNSYLKALAREILALIQASQGGAFVLFTSFQTLRAVLTLIGPELPSPPLVQGERSRPELLRRFKEGNNRVLFATKSFWEGVDVRGDKLRLVIIDRLPFQPPDDPVYEAQCERLGSRWFPDLALPRAILILKQAFGRLIRTKTDWGVVAILDGRILSSTYGKKILGVLPPARVTRDLEDVRSFFRERLAEGLADASLTELS